jgi:aerobic-type carbon monoxide dehydrogenase small subunit (CoxS/CutS family)
MEITLQINGSPQKVDVEPETPLLWVLRDNIGLTGTKYGCGIARCGACTVHIDGQAARSCTLPAAAAVGRKITTIEGLGQAGKPHPVQAAWLEVGVPQCGYCQSGQIMSAAALLARRPSPTDQEIDAAMADNLCRCGTYLRIKRGIHRAAELMQSE